jgi:hypothetical protein
MSQNQVSKAARRMNALAYQDGMVDLLLGVFLTFLAFQEPLEQSGLAIWVSYLPSFIAMGIGLIAYYFVKRKVVAPRIGLAKVSLRRNQPRRTIFLFAVGLQLITLLIYILAMTGRLGQIFPSGAGWTIDAFFAVAIFGFFAYLAYSAEAPRFYLYGLLLGSTALIQVPLRGNMSLAAQIPIMLPGLVMVVGGILTLISFLKRYPLAEVGAPNG